MATGIINVPVSMDVGGLTVIGTVSTRATLLSGGYKKWGKLIVINAKIQAVATAANSPQVAGVLAPLTDVALSCIDITNGIGSAIEESVPCGIGTDGKLFVKSITENHVYAISGAYVAS